MHLRPLLLLTLGCVACAASPARGKVVNAAPAQKVAAPAVLDRAPALAKLLPRGADRCVVARPALVNGQRRRLLTRLSQADGFAWLEELSIVAYASTQRSRSDGPSGMVTLLWVKESPEVVREALEKRAGLTFDWAEAAGLHCGGAGCPARARFVAPHLLRIERGIVSPADHVGVEARCLTMVEHDSQALEVSVMRNRSLDDPLSGADAVLSITSLRQIALGLRREQEEAEVSSKTDVLWEDLEFARDDDARLAAADRAAAVLSQEMPDGQAVPTRIEDVLAEIGARVSRMRTEVGDARVRHAQAARALLERAITHNPQHLSLALLLAELLLTEWQEPRAVHALAETFAGSPSAVARFAPLRRHAAALEGDTALAEALTKEGLADRRRAHTLAKSILLRMREGLPFAQAERMVLNAAR